MPPRRCLQPPRWPHPPPHKSRRPRYRRSRPPHHGSIAQIRCPRPPLYPHRPARRSLVRRLPRHLRPSQGAALPPRWPLRRQPRQPRQALPPAPLRRNWCARRPRRSCRRPGPPCARGMRPRPRRCTSRCWPSALTTLTLPWAWLCPCTASASMRPPGPPTSAACRSGPTTTPPAPACWPSCPIPTPPRQKAACRNGCSPARATRLRRPRWATCWAARGAGLRPWGR